MAKFVLDDQHGSVDVVVFSDLYARYARWLENGVAVLLTAAVKDTGGIPSGRSAALASAEQQAQQIQDEYGGHPENDFAAATAYRIEDGGRPDPPHRGKAAEEPEVSGYDVTDAGTGDEEKSDAERERERIGADVDRFNLGLFGGGSGPATPAGSETIEGPTAALPGIGQGEIEEPEPDAMVMEAASEEAGDDPSVLFHDAIGAGASDPVDFAARAATFQEAAVTPELNALEIMPLEGIREKKVKEISLEMAYPRMSEASVRKIREIFEEYPGDIPVSLMLTDIPDAVSASAPRLRMKLNQHFRVRPGLDFSDALEEIHADVVYSDGESRVWRPRGGKSELM